MAYAFPAVDAVVLYFTQSRYRSSRDRFRFHLGQLRSFPEYIQSWNGEIAAEWERVQARPSDAGLVRIPIEQLERYAGSYVHDDYEDEVFVKGDTLFYVIPDESATVPLHPLSRTSFIAGHSCSGLVFRITFLPGEDGTVNRFHLESRDGWEGIFERRR